MAVVSFARFLIALLVAVHVSAADLSSCTANLTAAQAKCTDKQLPTHCVTATEPGKSECFDTSFYLDQACNGDNPQCQVTTMTIVGLAALIFILCCGCCTSIACCLGLCSSPSEGGQGTQLMAA